MTLSPAVMNDLIPVYLAGEACPETRQLVEEYAQLHPEFAAALRLAAELEMPVPPASAAGDLEIAALRKTRHFVRLRSIFMGTGIFFTLAPFMFQFGSGGFEWLLIGRADGLVSASASLAAASWVAYWLMNREARKAGL